MQLNSSAKSLRSSKSNIESSLNSIVNAPVFRSQTSMNYTSQQQPQQQLTTIRTPINIDINTQIVPSSGVSSTTLFSKTAPNLLSPKKNLQINNSRFDANSTSIYSSNNGQTDSSIVNALFTQLKSPKNNSSIKHQEIVEEVTMINAKTPKTTPKSKGGRKPSDKTTNKQQANISTLLMLPSPSQTSSPLPPKSSPLDNDLSSFCFGKVNNMVTTTSNNRQSSLNYLSNFNNSSATTTQMSESNSPISENSSNSGYNNDNVSDIKVLSCLKRRQQCLMLHLLITSKLIFILL